MLWTSERPESLVVAMERFYFCSSGWEFEFGSLPRKESSGL